MPDSSQVKHLGQGEPGRDLRPREWHSCPSPTAAPGQSPGGSQALLMKSLCFALAPWWGNELVEPSLNGWQVLWLLEISTEMIIYWLFTWGRGRREGWRLSAEVATEPIFLHALGSALSRQFWGRAAGTRWRNVGCAPCSAVPPGVPLRALHGAQHPGQALAPCSPAVLLEHRVSGV